MCNKKTIKGFTLIEVLVVVVIIGVLSAISYPIFSKAIMKARATEAVNLLETVKKKQVNYYANKAAQSTGSYMSVDQLSKSFLTNSSQSLENGSLKIDDKYYLSSAGAMAQVAYKKAGSDKTLFTLSMCYDKAGLACTGEVCKSFGDTVVGSLECGGGCEGAGCEGIGDIPDPIDDPTPGSNDCSGTETKVCDNGCTKICNGGKWSQCNLYCPCGSIKHGQEGRGGNGCKASCYNGVLTSTQTPMSDDEVWDSEQGKCVTKPGACPDGTIILKTENDVHYCMKYENGKATEWVEGESC